MTDKYVLVTGGTGFIGSHLVEKLLKEKRKVKILALKIPFEPIEKENEELLRSKGAEIVYGNILKKETLYSALENVDTVYHLAAISRPMNILSKTYYDTNVQGTRNLLELCKEKNIKRFIHTSTVSVLGLSPDGHPLKEDEFQYDDLEYAITKREAELIALLYYYKYKVPVTVIRPSLVYGPRCLVRLIMFKFVKLGIFPLFEEGKAKIEFAYVKNVIDALKLAETNQSAIGETFNITDGKPYQIKDVLNTIAKTLNVNPPSINIPVTLGTILGRITEIISATIGIYPPFSRGTAHWMSKNVNVYDCSKAKKVLGYKPKYSLENGIEETVEWFKNKGSL